MRIIGGEFKSRLLKFPKSEKIRPLTDRMKETIFNILGDTVTGARVLDLFAGSGSFGLEAISRGAQEVCFVELEAEAFTIIHDNLVGLRIYPEKYAILRKSIVQAIRYLESRPAKFDLIFIDPPYNKGLIKKTLHQLKGFDIVQNFGKIVIHRSKHEALPNGLEGLQLQLVKEKPIGQAFVDILVKTN